MTNELTREQGLEFLNKDGNLRVPCSRYGHDTETCAPVAWRLAVTLAYETGEPLTLETLDYCMGLVVNDHDDVAYMLENYENSEPQMVNPSPAEIESNMRAMEIRDREAGT
jgi:hypothetical protein